MATIRDKLLKSISDTVADYRLGEVQKRSPELVDQWIQQFPTNLQEPLLAALEYVLGRTYISKEKFKSFLTPLATTDKLSPGSDPKKYWKEANLLDIQQGGGSQTDILDLFDEILQESHGFTRTDTGSNGGPYIYLDDCVGTGSRVRADICAWLENSAPEVSTVHIITPILYLGSYWIDKKIQETANANNKTIFVTKWRLDQFELQNKLSDRHTCDVLWPTALPEDPHVQSYAKYLEAQNHPVILRNAGNAGKSNIFADDAQKILLEQAFLVRGCQLRNECSNLHQKHRPLGYHNLDTLGFGSMFVTYRNCPNNCPLPFWVEQAEYPALFPRKTNTQTSVHDYIGKYLT